MRNQLATLLFCLCLVLPLHSQVPVSNKYFGLSMQSGVLYGEPWPTVSMGGIRLWDTQTTWAQLNPTSSTFYWNTLDQWLNQAELSNVDVLLTLGVTPRWGSSNPNDFICSHGPGTCDAPNDLNTDGSGTNEHWKNYVTAVATHVAGRVKYWEIWNEPQNNFYWNGTFAQMVRLAADARQIILGIDPNAIILTPGTGLRYTATRWMANYFAAGGGQYADIIAVHGYVDGSCPNTLPNTSVIPSRVQALRSMLQTFGQAAKPLWVTEAGWGHTSWTCFSNQDQQAGFVAQMYLLYWSSGVQRFYWYQWDNPDMGTLWANGILRPGIAYNQIANWMIGATMSSPCTIASDSTWTCGFTRAGGYQAVAIWNAANTKYVTVPPQYGHYQDVYGNVYAIPTGGSVQVGYKPVLLQP